MVKGENPQAWVRGPLLGSRDVRTILFVITTPESCSSLPRLAVSAVDHIWHHGITKTHHPASRRE